MTLNGFIKILYRLGMWLANFMFLHLLWIVFTIAGIGVFGIFPATAAVYNVVYQWINQHTDISIYQTFITYYKEYFKRSNIVGLIIVGISLFLYLDLRISLVYIQSIIFHYFILIVGLFFLIILMYLFTIQARYELSIFELFKQSFFIAIASPLETLAMIISFLMTCMFLWRLPFLAILMGSSLFIAPLVWFGYQACTKVEKKKING